VLRGHSAPKHTAVISISSLCTCIHHMPSNRSTPTTILQHLLATTTIHHVKAQQPLGSFTHVYTLHITASLAMTVRAHTLPISSSTSYTAASLSLSVEANTPAALLPSFAVLVLLRAALLPAPQLLTELLPAALLPPLVASAAQCARPRRPIMVLKRTATQHRRTT
jgi:hypothetical protein